jgi:hypothetical protein
MRALRLLTNGLARLDVIARSGRRSLEASQAILRQLEAQSKAMRYIDQEIKDAHGQLQSLKREVHDRFLQYHLQLGRLARAVDSDASTAPRLSGRTVPIDVEADEPHTWGVIGDAPPDPEGREWLVLEACPACGAIASCSSTLAR